MSTERWKPNVTVAAIVEQAGRFLLVEEQTRDGLMLNNPAGHLDCGESPEQAVVREVLEETARQFQPAYLVGLYMARTRRAPPGADTTYLRLAYAGEVGAPLPGLALDAGIVRTVWLTLDELRASVARHRSPAVLQGVEDYLGGARLPLGAVWTHASIWSPDGA